MTRYLLDTNMAGHFVNRRHGVHERVHDEVSKGNRVGIAMPVLAELVYGIEWSGSRDRNMQRLRTAMPSLKVWPFDEKAAFEYGRVAAELRRVGRPMQVVDMMVAAVAFSLGNCTVVSTDSDLSAVPGLKVENWVLKENGVA
jgi:tRNA(fMet)-specific endonuclease VapC